MTLSIWKTPRPSHITGHRGAPADRPLLCRDYGGRLYVARYEGARWWVQTPDGDVEWSESPAGYVEIPIRFL